MARRISLAAVTAGCWACIFAATSGGAVDGPGGFGFAPAVPGIVMMSATATAVKIRAILMAQIVHRL
ncbi:hypothetical protein Phou_014370 [Phytohabitans houttuyneae]|uniref:Uncharacterized protein n=1 Tax=Phytohabitans houttuyneae TaxID=1076126 RepID=A0A6V8K678_9ACTN|nr:hypothetical protein Phou_014370 [Phytohabitans houttuyneae]